MRKQRVEVIILYCWLTNVVTRNAVLRSQIVLNYN